jgi:glutathione synthase/RimK-type ligase-like ATP-grasp enzyme
MARRHLLALVSATVAVDKDEDLSPLTEAFSRIGVDTQVTCWDDPKVDWARFDLALVRSTWNYTERRTEFVAWARRVAQATRLFNAPEVLAWNSDKHYLQHLSAKGVRIVESHFIEPGDTPHSLPDFGELVVKPAVGAGSRDAQRYLPHEMPAALAHAKRLLSEQRSVLVQPYQQAVDTLGETAMLFFDGVYSHCIRKGPLLRVGEQSSQQLFAPEDIRAQTPSEAELTLARQVLAAVPFDMPLYARVDVLPSPQGPKLLELELTEPSLFFAHAPGSAERLVQAVMKRL